MSGTWHFLLEEEMGMVTPALIGPCNVPSLLLSNFSNFPLSVLHDYRLYDYRLLMCSIHEIGCFSNTLSTVVTLQMSKKKSKMINKT